MEKKQLMEIVQIEKYVSKNSESNIFFQKKKSS